MTDSIAPLNKEGENVASPTSQQNETLTILERAENLNKETREAENRIFGHRKAIEEIETRRIMGGQTHAGSINKSPEELKAEESNRLAQEIVGAFKKK